MQLAAFQQGLQLLPEQDGQVLRRRLRAGGDEVYIQVEVAVVYLVDDGLFDEPAQLLYIYNKAGHRIGLAFYCDKKVVVVPVPVFIGALSKGLQVLFLAPFFNPQLVGRIKPFSSS